MKKKLVLTKDTVKNLNIKTNVKTGPAGTAGCPSSNYTQDCDSSVRYSYTAG